jgi:hypothetical protein
MFHKQYIPNILKCIDMKSVSSEMVIHRSNSYEGMFKHCTLILETYERLTLKNWKVRHAVFQEEKKI